MIRHIVLFGLSDIAEGKTKAENALKMKQDLEKLSKLIPQIRKLEIGINCEKTPSTNWDVALFSEFDNLEDLDIYQKHPEHQKVVSFISKVRTTRAAVDYII